MMGKSNTGIFTLLPVLCVLTLFLLLSFVSVSVILAGSTVYESISENMDNNYEKRVALSYLTNKIRQNDRGIIGAEEVMGINMLAIREDFFGMFEYVTYIYYDEDSGCIREILLLADSGETLEFALSDGEEIVASGGFEFDVSERSAEITLTCRNGITQTALITLRTGG
ncbi:MAG: DUF4860 domain-containing protein [Oscillospiraceae bacterium]|nr:DUF4860 domain-containing protein [Oscillospiraceae bacterium]